MISCNFKLCNRLIKVIFELKKYIIGNFLTNRLCIEILLQKFISGIRTKKYVQGKISDFMNSVFHGSLALNIIHDQVGRYMES